MLRPNPEMTQKPNVALAFSDFGLLTKATLLSNFMKINQFCTHLISSKAQRVILQLHAPESAGRKLRLPSCSSSYWGKQANRVQADSDPSVEWISPLSAMPCTRRRIFNSLFLPVSMIWPVEARVNSP